MTTFDTTDHDDWLREIRFRLVSSCDEHTAHLLDLTTNTPNPVDAAAHSALLTVARQSLADATEALRRLDDGSYGRCARCGHSIPAERLEILPHARNCIACQSR